LSCLAGSAEAIPANTIADRLWRLEEAGIVQRDRYTERPPRYEYRLTDRGRALGPVLDALARWGTEHIPHTLRLGRCAAAADPLGGRRL
jgi:DNA-binding HxlR family transcriptional regulator